MPHFVHWKVKPFSVNASRGYIVRKFRLKDRFGSRHMHEQLAMIGHIYLIIPSFTFPKPDPGTFCNGQDLAPYGLWVAPYGFRISIWMLPRISVWQARRSFAGKPTSSARSASIPTRGLQFSKPSTTKTLQVVQVALPPQDWEMLKLFAFSILSKLSFALQGKDKLFTKTCSVLVETVTKYL